MRVIIPVKNINSLIKLCLGVWQISTKNTAHESVRSITVNIIYKKKLYEHSTQLNHLKGT